MKKIYLILPIFLFAKILVPNNTFTEEHVTNIPVKDVIIFDMETYKIAEAIKQKETRGNCNAVGKDGERGCYQTMTATYRALTKKHLGEVKGFSTTTQELVVYKEIEELRLKNIPVNKIFLYWNSGSYTRPCKSGYNSNNVYYDSCQYVKDSMKIYNSLQ